MQTHLVKSKTKRIRSIKIGRGGKRGKTSGRGHKGQKQHGGHGIRPNIRDIIKKIPKLRGRGKNINKSAKVPAYIVNIETLDKNYKDGGYVSAQSLYSKGLIKKVGGNFPPVKILSMGETKKKLNINGCLFSKKAKEKLEKGGSIIK